MRKYNLFTFKSLPSAFWAGVRVIHLDEESCTTTVKLNWFTKNPFKSMFWAIQGMAAELATGLPITLEIREAEQPISMLVLNNKANFSKKARGRIHFVCKERARVKEAVAKTLATNQSQTIWLTSVGTDQAGDVVSTFKFEWTLKAK